jgi:uncharacterized glyoxalase superfamily protein PhnB
MPHAHVSLITLGVTDLRRTARFYETLGFVRKMKAAGDDVAFFEAGSVVLSLLENEKLADDAALKPEAELPAFRGIALAWNCETEGDVDKVLAAAGAAGARLLKPAQKAFWGGYHGYFADPEGHVWEVAHNPHFPLSPDGKPNLPD